MTKEKSNSRNTPKAIGAEATDQPSLSGSPGTFPSAPPLPDGTAPDPFVAASGIGTLVVGYEIEAWRNPDMMEILVDAKKQASTSQFVVEGCSLDWCGWKVEVQPRGSRGYEWQFYNGDVAVKMAQKAESGRRFPEVYVTFFAAFLWREGWDRAAEMVWDWVNTWGVVIREKVSRADLTMDVAIEFPELDIRRDLVTRARTRVEWQTADEIVGYSRGVRPTTYRVGSGDLVGKIYDKLDESKIKHKEWFHDLWRLNGWDGETGVTRVEFQVRRGMLKEFNVNTIEDLMQRLGDMWRYFTQDWLRAVKWQKRGQHDRWKLRPLWKTVQAARILFGECYGVLRLKQKQVASEPIWAQGIGCIKTTVAHRASVTSIHEAMWNLRKELRKCLNDSEFQADIEKRIHKLANAGPARDYLVNEAVRNGAKVNGASF